MRAIEASVEQRWNERAGKRENPEKTRRPTASSGTIPTCENPDGARLPEAIKARLSYEIKFAIAAKGKALNWPPECYGGRKLEISEKIRRPAVSSCKIPTCENTGRDPARIRTLSSMVRSLRSNRCTTVSDLQARPYSLMNKCADMNCALAVLRQWKAVTVPAFSKRCQTPCGPMAERSGEFSDSFWDKLEFRTRVFIELRPLVDTVLDTTWGTVVQSSSSTVTADNQCTVDIGIIVYIL
ncbi:hypothetical protein PR048_003579 [Dryococelus australis]|uniref:Uncharacterized protein n=1 Tax=Dryococelus australis TaxID=614101 RepID=A0ABQ9INK2_9NEOP|nr:hypothetical protein PR048_003579 [Dryococelus australis]